MLKIRRAFKEEMAWVNDRYDEVKFVHSHFDNEIIAIAEWGQERAGLGRLVHVTGQDWELGGMYVLETFRGQGIAEEIIHFLLSQAPRDARIFCLPFSHLRNFYAKFGFGDCAAITEVPKAIVEKHRWCNETYPYGTLLFLLKKKKSRWGRAVHPHLDLRNLTYVYC